jgi:hypothetical protein
VIDTPGLGSLTGASGPTETLLALDAESRGAISHADALLFVMSGELHQDDVTVLDSFHQMMSGVRASAVNAIGLLNKVDLIGGGAPNAVELGRARAEKLAGLLRSSVATVLPLVGLLAETTETAALSGEHTRMLAAIGAADPADRDLALLSVDRFVTSPSDIPVPGRRELIKRLDITGLRAAVDLLAAGSDIGAMLAELRARSGIQDLTEALHVLFAKPSDALKAEWGIGCLERMTGSSFPPSMAGSLEEVLADPGMHALQELRALQRARASEGALSPEALGELARLVSSDTLRSRLGVSPAASAQECQDAAAEGSRRWADMAGSIHSGIVARRVAAVVRRSFDLMWQEAARQEAMV